jgi:hypothetical protein
MTERIRVFHSEATADIVVGALVEFEAVPYIVTGIVDEPPAGGRHPMRLALEPATRDQVGAAGFVPVVQIRATTTSQWRGPMGQGSGHVVW